MVEVHVNLHRHQRTMQQSGYHAANNALQGKLLEMMETLAAQTSQGWEAMANLTNKVVSIQQQLTNRQTKLAKRDARIAKLETDLAAAKQVKPR